MKNPLVVVYVFTYIIYIDDAQNIPKQNQTLQTDIKSFPPEEWTWAGTYKNDPEFIWKTQQCYQHVDVCVCVCVS